MSDAISILYVLIHTEDISVGWSLGNVFSETTIFRDSSGKIHLDEDMKDELIGELFTAIHKWTREQERRLIGE